MYKNVTKQKRNQNIFSEYVFSVFFFVEETKWRNL